MNWHCKEIEYRAEQLHLLGLSEMSVPWPTDLAAEPGNKRIPEAKGDRNPMKSQQQRDPLQVGVANVSVGLTFVLTRLSVA
jgi:hypothetical protein